MSLFKEDNGNWSMTRLIVFIGAGSTIIVTLCMIVYAVVNSGDPLLIGALGAFFVAAMGVFAAWKTKSKQAEADVIEYKSVDGDDDGEDGPGKP